MKHTRNTLFSFLLATVILLVSACKGDNNGHQPDVSTPFTLSQSEISLKPGESTEILISGGSGKFSTFIKNVGVASATATAEKLQIKGHTQGVETLTVKDQVSGETKEVKINVIDKIQLASTVTELAIYPGTIKVFHISNGSGDYKVESKDTGIVSIMDIDGSKVTIRGESKGSTSVIITDNTNDAVLEIPASVDQRHFVLEKDEITLIIGDESSLAIKSGNGTYEISASKSGVVEATAQDFVIYVKALSVGETTLTIKDLLTNEIQKVNVIVKYRPLVLDVSEVTITLNNGGTLNVTDGNGQYTVSVPEGSELISATLDNGKITIKAKGKVGKAVLKVTDTLSGEEKEVNVTINEKVMKIKLNKEEITLRVGATEVLEVLDADWMVDYYKISYNEAPISVSQPNSGVYHVYAKAPGKTVINIMDYYGELLAEVPVTVIP